MKFTTKDKDNDLKYGGSCGVNYGAGWWFNNCAYACLTCEFGSQSIVWYSLTYATNENSSVLKTARMMIRSN